MTRMYVTNVANDRRFRDQDDDDCSEIETLDLPAMNFDQEAHEAEIRRRKRKALAQSGQADDESDEDIADDQVANSAEVLPLPRYKW